MPANKDEVSALFARVDEFHVTDKSLKRSHERIRGMLHNGSWDTRAAEDYVKTVKSYFENFQKEAQAHLRTVDRRLEHVNQVHFNLCAERGVAVKRIEITQDVLSELRKLQA